ncbi:hypothetical protein [Ureibacillus chungkukjangi]|uniref:Uncharacterized protein n=1 Tax=Ureibacillus chungkukjangi TaxID=1202712 RepID=A0A318TWI6_9BACL|nr:hypothetical protein [Ureibacillus chungkukjangi]MCM3389586.1 hypothetical protein [Ureibacillus chungkukjangi]PYF06345.1 hypothetical protein BJ095_11047 [Ureibacillus chungkukjangi]
MLKVDEQLLNATKGIIGEPLEDAILNLTHSEAFHHEIFGALLPLDSILVTKTRAQNLIITLAQKYWGNVDLFLHATLQETKIDLENANDRLEAYFSSNSGKKAIHDYITIHNRLEFESLIGLVFGKEVKIAKSKSVGGLRQIYVYQVGNKYFVHTILNDNHEFWDVLFIKKIYSLFMQTSLATIHNANELIKHFKSLLESHFTLNQSVIITNHLISFLDQENIRSYHLKELHLYNLISHFNGGKRHFRKVDSLIEEIISSWGNGKWALSEKEYTLLSYIQAITAAEHNDTARVIEFGKYLIENDRLVNHAIELFLEYSDVLPNFKPEPNTLVKRYDNNYLEQIFYILIDALVQNHKYYEVVELLKQHEIASCISLYEYFNREQFDEDAIFKIEATVQRDIAYIVHDSPQHVVQSIEIWLQNYPEEKSPFFEIAYMTSKHICNVLKALFVTEHYELFEKLMEVYKKYLKIDTHFADLRDFVSAHVKS